MAYMSYRLRRDTATNWTTLNPILGSGELGYETDTYKLKIGNGVTAWASRGYLVNSGGGISIEDVEFLLLDYYTSLAIDGLLAGYAPLVHTHVAADITDLASYTGFDARYFTESEVTSLLAAQNALSELSDVTLTTPATGATLQYDGAVWVDALASKLYDGTEAVVETDALRVTVTGRQFIVEDDDPVAFADFAFISPAGGGFGFAKDYSTTVAYIYADHVTDNMFIDNFLGRISIATYNAAEDIRLEQNLVTVARTISDGLRITRRLRVDPVAGNVATPANGDIWYNSTTGKFMAQEAGASFEMLASKPYDLSLYIQGKPTDAELVLRLEVSRAFSIAAGASDSHASARVASSASKVFDLLKNGVSFGSVTFATSATGSFTVGSLTTFAAGDVLTITAPATADTTLEDISITLVGTRS